MIEINIGNNYSVNMSSTTWLQNAYNSNFAGGSFSLPSQLFSNAYFFTHSPSGATVRLFGSFHYPNGSVIPFADSWTDRLEFVSGSGTLILYIDGFPQITAATVFQYLNLGSVSAVVSYIDGLIDGKPLKIEGGFFADALVGHTGNDILIGLSGNDSLNGGTGTDKLLGGAGNDTYTVNSVGDLVTELAGEGTDIVRSSVSFALPVNVERLTLTGTAAINATGNTQSNTLTGNAGNNVLNGGLSGDTMVGGAGNDTYVVNSPSDVVTELVSQGTDTLSSAVTYTLPAYVENLILTGTGTLNGTGNWLANVLTGNAGNNVLNGGTGNDTLTGGAGADTLLGGGGSDTLNWDALDVKADGGADFDYLRINGAGQTLNLLTVANTKIQNIEVINLTGSGNNRLELSLQDVLDLSSTTNTLRVDGNAGDVVDRNAGWTQGANQVLGANTYRTYTQGLATLLVDTDITVTT